MGIKQKSKHEKAPTRESGGSCVYRKKKSNNFGVRGLVFSSDLKSHLIFFVACHVKKSQAWTTPVQLQVEKNFNLNLIQHHEGVKSGMVVGIAGLEPATSAL